MDIRAALMTGIDIPVPECQLILHQPPIKDIAMMGEEDFFIAVQTLCLHKSMFEQGETLLSNTNNFQIFMTIMSEKETADKKALVQQLFTLILPNNKVIFTPQSLLVTGGEQPIQIDENNFDYLQETVREIFCLNSNTNDQRNFNPSDKKAKEIAEKLMRGRQRIAQEKGQSNASIIQMYLSILSIGLHISMLELSKYTMFQLYDSLERFSLYTNFDLDVRTRLAGGKPDGSPENWMKSIH